MTTKRFNPPGFRRASAGRGWFALTCLMSALTLASCTDSAAQSDPVVARHMGAFFEAFLGRKLSGSELRKVADEFIRIHTGEGKNRTAIHETAQSFDAHANTLREDQDSPVALTLRHLFIEVNYFRPAMKNTIELRLLTEPDPVRVVDLNSKRLMTERDVIALANLRTFATSQGDPIQREFAPRELDQMVEGLERNFGGDSGKMPRFFGEAAAYWAGVRRHWPHLSAEERDLARAYANKTWRIRMPPEMFGKLLGLDPGAAFKRHADDVGMRLDMITALTLEAGNLPLMLDSIFPP